MALHIHHGPRLVDLADVLAGQLRGLADRGVDPFEPVVVGVPTAGVRDWLSRHLAQRLGVVANVRMVFPAKFIALCAGDEQLDHDPWAVPRLTWAVFQALQAPAGGDVDVPGPRTLYVARRIADLFDSYANNRPSVIQQWAAGLDGNGLAGGQLDGAHAWQPVLWRQVRALIGSPSPAELRADRLAELAAGPAAGGRVPALPTQAALFGVSAISPAQLDVLLAAGSYRDLHVFAAHPSPAAWARSGRRLGGRLTPRTADTAAQPAHPLLRSWAAPSMELTALVSGTAAHVQRVASSAPPPTTALGALQAAIINDHEPARVQPMAHDGSLQVHLCHGTLRQVEVLRDSLCALFAADHTLQPHQVLVVSPQLDRFAPLAASVFQRSVPPVPVRVSDLALGSENPVAVATVQLLALLGSRCTVGHVLEVCALPAVARRMGFTSDDLATYQRWAGELNIRWGLDADHRHEWLHLDIDEGTWEAALDRLLLGAAMPAPTVRRAAHDIVPYDDVDAAAFESAGRLAEVVQQLRTARRRASVPMPVAEWCRLTAELVSSVCAADRDAPWQEADVLAALHGLASDASQYECAPAAGGATGGIELAEAAVVIAEAIATTAGRLSLRSGAVTLTSMVPVRNVPARVVCILGLDDSSYGGRGVGDDILALQPCVGERDPSAEGRALLLDAVLAAEQHCIITCDGIDITTNRPIALPVALGELLEATGGTDLAVRHPRHGWDARNLRPEAPFSFDPVMAEAARAMRAAADMAGPVEYSDLLPVVVPARVTVTELTEACTRPARTYLRHGVDVRLPAGLEDADDNVALSAGALQRSQLGRSLMDQHKRWGDAELAQTRWRDAATLTGELPPRQLALAVVDVVSAGVGQLIGARPEVAEAFAATTPIPVDVRIAVAPWAQQAHASTAGVQAPAPSTVVLSHDVHQVAGDCLVRVEFSRPKHRQVVSAAIELAALCVAYPAQPWSAIVIRRPAKGDGQPDVVELAVRDPQRRAASAQRLLDAALDLRLRAAREPIPLFEGTSALIATDGQLSDETVFEGSAYGPGDLSDEHVSFVWSAVSAEEVLSVEYRHGVDEPVPPRSLPGFAGHSRAASFAFYLWDALDDFVAVGGR
jgi:exodeoxyribonuclease V gamma subunit